MPVRKLFLASMYRRFSFNKKISIDNRPLFCYSFNHTSPIKDLLLQSWGLYYLFSIHSLRKTFNT